MNRLQGMAEKSMGKRETDSPAQPKFHPTDKMHAILWKGAKKLSYSEVPKPMIADPRDILLRVTASTICGSDLHLHSGNVPTMRDGDILGHECMGIIEDIGSEVKNLHVGQRVVVAFDIACGTCGACQRQEFTGCSTTNPSNMQKEQYGTRTAALFGYSHLTGGVPGCQAEYVRVPYAEVNCLPVPESVPDEKALYLSDVVPTAYHGVVGADVGPGDVVALWGLGPIGLIAARWCQILGAKRVIGIDNVPERLALAKEKLGIEVIDFSKSSVVKTLLEWFPLGIDAAIECAGFEYPTSTRHKVEMAIGMETDTSDIFVEMFSVTRAFGRISILGVYVGTANHFPVGAMMQKGLQIRSGQSPTQKYWKHCLECIQSGEMDPTIMVSNKGKLSDGIKLYDQFSKKEAGVMKVFLRPDNWTETGFNSSKLAASSAATADSTINLSNQTKTILGLNSTLDDKSGSMATHAKTNISTIGTSKEDLGSTNTSSLGMKTSGAPASTF